MLETVLATPAPQQLEVAGKRRRIRLSIATVLVTGFGSLMLAAVASVLVLGLTSAGRNTFALLGDKANLALDGLDVRIRHQLDPARDQAQFLAALIADGELDPTDTVRMIETLRASLAATPQVTGISFTRTGGASTRVVRIGGRMVVQVVTDNASPTVRPALADAAQRQGPYWVDPVWGHELHASLLTLRMPVRRQGDFLGMIVVAVSLSDLSRFLSTMYADNGISAFVLYDRTHVIAHRALPALQLDYSAVQNGPPLPQIDQVNDPILASIWSGDEVFEQMKREATTRVVSTDGEEHVVLMRPLEGYGQHSWTIGIDFRFQQVGMELQRLLRTGIAGLVILIASVAAALFVGRRISRQIVGLAAAAESIADLDFRKAQRLPDSRLRELADASAAFNAMVAGLRWFETYVPKSLVLRLMHRGSKEALAFEGRDVTVMFTDIRGFSALAERMSPAETAALLNDHFTLLAGCIEGESGTVDKFIGDAVMAFWGAPEEQADHAARALRAAQAIARALAEDNRARTARRLPAVRVRIGLHSGPAVVGNIGSASRMNYTIVGDTVNVAARIEEFAAHLQDGEDVIILASGTTARAGEGCVPVEEVGTVKLRGISAETPIFRLVP